VFVGIIVLFLVAVLVTKKLLERSQARHWAHSGDGDANTLEEAEE
jgi:hypothetical protein